MMIPRKRSFFDDVFDDSIFSRKELKQFMKTDIEEKDGNYIFTIDVPGVEKSNIDIDLENGYLTVSANTKTEVNDEKEDGKYIYKERYCGECSRTYFVGEEIKEDDVKAAFKNGILTITVPAEKEKIDEPKKRIQID